MFERNRDKLSTRNNQSSCELMRERLVPSFYIPFSRGLVLAVLGHVTAITAGYGAWVHNVGV